MRGRPTLTNPHIPTGRRGYVGVAKRTATKRFDGSTTCDLPAIRPGPADRGTCSVCVVLVSPRQTGNASPRLA